MDPGTELHGRRRRAATGPSVSRLALLLAFSGTACGGSPGVGNATSVADSSGVSFVVSEGPDIRLDIVEEWKVGVTDGDPIRQFHRIWDMALDREGAVWVVDRNERVRRYDRDGVYVGGAGGAGEGPGESAVGYRKASASSIGVLLQAADAASLQVFDDDGGLLDHTAGRAPRRVLNPLGSDGDVWTLVWEDMRTSAATHAGIVWTVVRTREGFSMLDTVLSRPGFEYEALGGGEGAWARTSALGGVPAIAGDSHGQVYYSHPLEYRIEVFDRDGRLSRVLVRDVSRVAYPRRLERAIERVVERRLERNGPVDRARVEALTVRALPADPPRHLPILDAIFVAGDGALWARRVDRHPDQAVRAVAYAFGDIPAQWPAEWKVPTRLDRFGPDGAYTGSATFPAEFIPMAVADDRVVGSRFDSLDVEHLVSFRVVSESNGQRR